MSTPFPSHKIALPRRILKGTPTKDTGWPENVEAMQMFPLAHFVWLFYQYSYNRSTDELPCHIHLPVCLWIMDPLSRAPKMNTSHGNEVLPQDIRHPIQRPCYQRGSPCQDTAGNRITRRPDDRKETQTAVVWSCFPFIRSGQNHLARHSERGKKTR